MLDEMEEFFLSIYHASSIETAYSNDQTVLLGCLNDIFDLFYT